MNTRVAITHRIDQRFDHPVRLSTHWLRLRPAPQTRARIQAYSLRVHAQPHFLNWVRDPFENYLARLDLPEPVSALGLELEMIAELEPSNPFDFLAEPDAAQHPFVYAPQLHKELAPYLKLDEPGPRLQEFLQSLDRGRVSTVERLTAVNQQVNNAVDLAAADGITPRPELEALLSRGAGTSWELAWLLTVSLRHLGLAARFACGHRVVLGEGLLPDGVSLHAWSEAFVPGAGWIGLDPSAGLFTDEKYIPFACAPDPLRVQPWVGFREACEETQQQQLRVHRLLSQTPSWPLTATQWGDIDALGGYVERDLTAQGIEPTVGVGLSFVSATDPGAPEWNTASLGPGKRAVAEALLLALRQRLAPGAALSLGQGQWFAGELLPRWRLGCFFRADGQPIWRSAERLGWGRTYVAMASDHVERFAFAVARALGLPPGRAIAAYEDPLHAAWKAGSAPALGPSDVDLGDPQARRALAERLSQADAEPIGYVLPIRWDHRTERWGSGTWSFRRSRLHLLPGDSPLGYRLPLEGLPEDEHSALEAQVESSTFADRPLLREFHGEVSARLSVVGAPEPTLPSADEDADGARAPRTALCVQARGGQLFVFIPPLAHLEHYLELVAAIEAAAVATDAAVILEGYDPPEDYRLLRLTIEPDAGVLHVNLPHVRGWRAQVEGLQAAYEEAHAVGLRAERQSLEGERLPSGGGGCIALGAVRPVDSPFLRRPELLRALIAYVQRHPSLSYLFAGRSIGSSGGAPRPDEGRDEALHELSIALDRLPCGPTGALWHADRVLRHLLADPAGDLKRAEIRVDQLYAPQRASLRLGRIVLNSFETAPEPRMAALQSLLLQGLLGRFARVGDSGELRRWGTALHDRFMLPHVLWQDLGAVVADLNAVGYPFQREWFEPLRTLRFPVLGSVPIGTIQLELQRAHEPWPLLAEEMTGGGMARFIDAANERVQVRLTGLTPGRYVLACNRQYVPLRATGVHGESVAGVRHKVANPPSTLHPTVAPVESLVFDLIDTWTGRAVGGCTYLPPQPLLWGPIGSPLGAALPPTTGSEAVQPRVAQLPFPSLAPAGRSGRFLPYGSGLGPMTPPPPFHDEEYPYLLDLTQRLLGGA